MRIAMVILHAPYISPLFMVIVHCVLCSRPQKPLHRQYVPELLPKFVSLISDAERTMNYDHIRGALGALEALGSAVDEHLHLLLPALTRLVAPPSPNTPVDMRRLAIRWVLLELARALLLELGGSTGLGTVTCFVASVVLATVYGIVRS